MAHLPPEKIPAFEPFSQRKTLFAVSPGTEAILVTLTKRGRRQRPLKFKDAQAALAWAMENGVTFVLTPCSDPAAK